MFVTGVSAGRPAGRRTRASRSGGRRSNLRVRVLAARAAGRHVYFEQIRVLKAGSNVAGYACVPRCTALNMVAWNNGTRPRSRLYAVPQRVNVALAAVPCAGRRSRSRIRVRVVRSTPCGCDSVTVRGLRIVGTNLGCWPVFGTGGNDQQRQAWAFVPRR